MRTHGGGGEAHKDAACLGVRASTGEEGIGYGGGKVMKKTKCREQAHRVGVLVKKFFRRMRVNKVIPSWLI